MAEGKWEVLFNARINDSSFGEEWKRIQQYFDKNTVKMMPKLEESSFNNQLKELSGLVAKEFNKKYKLNVDSKDVMSALKSAEKELNAINKQFNNTVNQAFTDLRKNAYQSIGQKSPELTKMADYYKNLEKQAAETTEKVNQSFANMRKQAYQSIGQKSPELTRMAEYYTKMAQEAEKVGAVKQKMDLSSVDASVAKVTASYERLSKTTTQLDSDFARLKELQQSLASSSSDEKLVADYEKFNQTLQKVTNQVKTLSAEQNKVSGTSMLSSGKTDFLNKMSAYLRNNSALSKELTAEIKNIMNAVDRVDDASGLRNLEKQFKSVQLQAKATGQTGRSILGQVRKDFSNFGTFVGVGTLTMQAIYQIRNAFNEFKEVDTILTEISKTSGQAREELESLGKTAYESASAYGRTVTDYLNAVKEMNRAGFYGESGNKMAELSLLTQSAGDMTSELSNDYLLATNAAYRLQGDTQKLNDILDGQDLITNRNALSMSDMANAMKITGALAAQTGVKIDELSAFIGTATATTKKSGDEIGTSFKAIFTNLQNVTSSKIVNTLKEAGTSMTVMKDGIEQLRTPTEILKDLAKTYNSLEDRDPLKQKITTNIGGKYHGSVLAATLSNFDQYEKMLKDYAEADNTARQEMEKSKASWEGHLNTLGNSFKSFLKNFANTSMIKGFLDILTGVANGLDFVTTKLGGLGTVVATVGLVELIRNFNALKASIDSLRGIQAIANEINAIPLVLDGATRAMRPETVTAYVNSLQGLSLEQAKIALATSQLTEAQKIQVLSQAGLMASNEAISASMVAQAMAETGLSTAKQEEVLINAGLMASDTKVAIGSATCTKAKLEEALATAGITGANAQAIVSNTGLATSAATTSISIGTLTASIKANIAAMWAWMTSNPLGWLMIAGTAIFSVTKLVDIFTTTLEEQKEALKDAEDEFSNVSQEVSDITSKLKENEKAMDELLKKPKLTYADESELERLRLITKELELQKDATKENQKKAATNLANETIKTFDKEFGNLDELTEGKGFIPDYAYWASASESSAKKIIPDIIALQEQFNKELKNGNLDMASTIKNTMNIMEENLKSGDYADALKTLSEEKQNLLKVMDFRELNESEKNKLDQISQWQKSIYEIVNPNEWNALEFDSIFNTKGIERTKEELINLAKAGELTPEKIGQWKNLSEAIQGVDLITKDGVTNTEEFINQLVACAQGAENAISGVGDEANKVFEGFDLGEEEWKEIDNFTQKLETFKAALNDGNLDTSELMNLMKMTPTADWSSYMNGAKSLREVLYELSEGELEDLSTRFPALAGQMKELFGETFGMAKKSSEDLIGALDRLAGAFGSLEKAYKETEENGFKSLSIDAMSGLQDKFGNMEGWDNFFKTVTEGNPSIEETRNLLSGLCDEYINTSGVLNTLTEANKKYFTQQLEANGVVNAAEIVNERLASISKVAAEGVRDLGLAHLEAGYNAKTLADMTGDEVGQLYEELRAAGVDSEALKTLAEMKGWVNSTVINTDTDNSNLSAEEEQSYDTKDALDAYAEAKTNSNNATVQTGSDISSQSNLADSSDRTSGYLYDYRDAKAATNRTSIQTGQDIANLRNLESAARHAADVVSRAMSDIRNSKMTASSLQREAQQAAKSGVGNIPKNKPSSNPIANYKNRPRFSAPSGEVNNSSNSNTENNGVPEFITPKNGLILSEVSVGRDKLASSGRRTTAIYRPPSSPGGGSGSSKSGGGSRSNKSSKNRSNSSKNRNNSSSKRGSSSKSNKSSSSKSKSNKSSKSSSSKKSKSETKKDTSEIFDWIENKLESLKNKTQSIAKTITDTISKAYKTKQLKKQISAITDEINANNKAYDSYMKKANKVGLNKKYRDLVKKGNFKIETVKDEKLQEKIKQYEEYYNKAKDCKDAVSDLKREQQELNEALYNMPNEKAAQEIDSLSKRYDILSSKANAANAGKAATSYINYNADSYVSSAKKTKDNAYKNRKKASDSLKSAKKKASKVKLSKSQKAALKAGKKIDTKGLKKKDKKIINDYNKKLDAYNKANNSYKSASINYDVQKEYANSIKYRNESEWQLQNRAAEDMLSNKKSQVNVYKKAYDETSKKLKTLKKGTAEYNAALKAQKEAADNLKNAQYDLAQSLVETGRAQFDNVKNYYDTETSYKNLTTKAKERTLENQKAKGNTITESMYSDIIKAKKNEKQAAVEQRKAMEKQLNDAVKSGKVKQGSQEWKKMKMEIDSVNDSIFSLDNEIEGLYDTLREEVIYQKFTRAFEATEKVRQSVSSVLELLDSESYYDDKGGLTGFGKVALAGELSNLKQYQDDILIFREKQAKLDKDYKNRNQTHMSKAEYDAATEENQKGLQETIKNMANTRKAIINMMQEQSKLRLDGNLKLIDSYKKLIQQQNEYYNYDKNLKKGQKELEQIQAKIAAVSGLSDAESLAQKAKLEEELKQKQEEIDDTVREHVYNLKVDNLDELQLELNESYEKYVKELSTNFDVIQKLIKEATSTVSGSAKEVHDTIIKILDSYGLKPSDVGIEKGTIAGFASGGYVEQQVRKNGDTGIASLKRGEYVLDEDLTNLALSTLPQLTALSQNPVLKSLSKVKTNTIAAGSLGGCDVNIHYDNMINIESGGIVDVVTLKELNKMVPKISDKIQKDLAKDLRKM